MSSNDAGAPNVSIEQLSDGTFGIRHSATDGHFSGWALRRPISGGIHEIWIYNNRTNQEFEVPGLAAGNVTMVFEQLEGGPEEFTPDAFRDWIVGEFGPTQGVTHSDIVEGYDHAQINQVNWT